MGCRLRADSKRNWAQRSRLFPGSLPVGYGDSDFYGGLAAGFFPTASRQTGRNPRARDSGGSVKKAVSKLLPPSTSSGASHGTSGLRQAHGGSLGRSLSRNRRKRV